MNKMGLSRDHGAVVNGAVETQRCGYCGELVEVRPASVSQHERGLKCILYLLQHHKALPPQAPRLGGGGLSLRRIPGLSGGMRGKLPAWAREVRDLVRTLRRILVDADGSRLSNLRNLDLQHDVKIAALMRGFYADPAPLRTALDAYDGLCRLGGGRKERELFVDAHLSGLSLPPRD